MRRFLTLCCSILAVSCSNPVEVRSDIARITVDGQAIVVANIGDAPLYYFAADRNALALLDWIPCTDPAKCIGIASGASKRIAFSEVVAYQPGSAEAVVYHWRLIPGNAASGFVMDSLRATIVPMK